MGLKISKRFHLFLILFDIVKRHWRDCKKGNQLHTAEQKGKQMHVRKRKQEKSLTNWRQMYLYRITMEVADMIYLSIIGAIIGAMRKRLLR